MSHLEDIAKSMGISSDELFSGKYGDNYDEILDNLMMKKLNESKATEDYDEDFADAIIEQDAEKLGTLLNLYRAVNKEDEDEYDDGEYYGYESKANEDWYDVPDMGDYKPEVMKWNLVFVDDGSDWGYQTNNKAEAERQVEDWNKDDASMTGRPIKMVNQWEQTAYYGESYASEMGDVLIDDTPYGLMEPDNPNSPMGDWTTLYGTSYTDGRQTIVDVPDDEEKAFTDILEQEGYDWIPEKGYYGFKKFEKEAKASEREITQDVVDWFDNMSPNEKIRYATGSTRFEDLDNVEKSNVQQQYYYIHGESYASEDSLVKIEDDDDEDTKVTVLDEWENETDPDVGGDVEGLDQDQKDSSESWSKKSFNQKVEALEAVGFRQGKALRFASLAFEDFSKELQEAIDSVTQEDAEDEQEFIRQTQEDEKEAGLIEEVDYNNIGESRTARSKYECEFCNCGFKSNESLTIHYNDLHAVPPAQIDGYEAQPELESMMSYNDESKIAGWLFRNYNIDYNDLKEEEKQKYREEYKDRYIGNSWQEGGENWKEVADDLYNKELAKLKKRGGEAHGEEEGTSDGAKKGWLTRKRGGGKTEEPTKKQTKTNTKLDNVKDKLLSKLNSGSDYYVKVANLDGYPQNTSQLRGVPSGVKGVIMKSQLTDSYDGSNFSVRKDGYNGLNVGWTGGDGGYPYGAQNIANLYSDKGSTNSMVDYYDVDTYVGSVTDDRKDKHPKDPYHVVDSRESRFGNWIYNKINEDWSGYREKFGGHIDLNVTKTMADHILNEPEVTGFNNVEYSDFADLKKEFLEEEKRTGGGNRAKDLPKSNSASSYSQQYMGEDPSKPSKIPYDPNTGEELPVSSFNPNDTKYRKPKETDTGSDMAKAYGDMMAKKKNPDQPMWAGGEADNYQQKQQMSQNDWNDDLDYMRKTFGGANDEIEEEDGLDEDRIEIDIGGDDVEIEDFDDQEESEEFSDQGGYEEPEMEEEWNEIENITKESYANEGRKAELNKEINKLVKFIQVASVENPMHMSEYMQKLEDLKAERASLSESYATEDDYLLPWSELEEDAKEKLLNIDVSQDMWDNADYNTKMNWESESGIHGGY